MNNERRKSFILGLVVVVGIACAALLVRLTDSLRPPVDPNLIDENLYLSDKTARRMSLGFNGLAADWYWMRSLQYVGTKMFNYPGDIRLDDMSNLNLRLLAPLLNTATTLDPQFIEPYKYAAVIMPAIDVQHAIRLTQKGIDANPNAWQLYHHLGYIYWRQGLYDEASKTYGRGAQIPGAPAWMEAMRAKLISEGGSRSTAREIYTRMYEQAGEEHVRDMARKQLMRLESLDQQDGLRKLFTAYKARSGKCPDSWRELTQILRTLRIQIDQSGAPLDPSGAPYVLQAGACEVELDANQTKVPLR